MQTDHSQPLGSLLARLIEHARMPLFRNGYSLVFSTIATSGLGMLYWILAARLYPTEVVGLNTAVLSTAVFLANLAQLNQVNALNRFLPAVGRSASRFIGMTYLVSAGAGVIAGVIFLLGIRFWAPSLGFLAENPLLGLAFTAGVILWVLFVLQDGAVTGLRQAVWVPVKNVAVSVVKMILLVAFAGLIPTMGVLASWLVPLAVALVVMNFFLFRRLVPNHIRDQGEASQPVHPKLVAQYVSGDFLGALFWIALVDLQPVVVVERLGASANAYFFLAWQIAYSLFLVSRSMSMSLLAEVSLTPSRLNDYSFRILKQTGRMVLPVVAVIVIGAPQILWLFGREYAQEGTVLLRYLALSTIPYVIIQVYMSMIRAQNKIRQLALVQASHSILILVLLILLVVPFGVTGIGLAWLVGQSLVALVLLATGLRRMIVTQIDLRLLSSLFHRMSSLLGRRRERRQIIEVDRIIHRVLDETSNVLTDGRAMAAYAPKIVRTVNDVTVVQIATKTGESAQESIAYFKLAGSPPAAESLRHQKEILSTLRSDVRLKNLHPLLPRVLQDGTVEGTYYLIEEKLPGRNILTSIDRTQNHAQIMQTAAQAIDELHRSTAERVTIDRRFLQRWVDDRLSLVRDSLTGHSPLNGRYSGAIDRATEEIYAALEGKQAVVSWIHGDYSPENILLGSDGKTVTGIVDWDQAAQYELPELDLIQLILAMRMQQKRREMGDVLRSLLGGDLLSPVEQEIIDRSVSSLQRDRLDLRTLLLLTWLRHVTANLTKSTRYAGNWIWRTKNVEAVFDQI